MSQQKPIADFSIGSIQASVWPKEKERGGETVVRYSVKIQKQYRKDDGDFQDTDYYFQDELPRLILVAQEAYKFLCFKHGRSSNDND